MNHLEALERFDREYELPADGRIYQGTLDIDDMPIEDVAVAAVHPALHLDVRAYAERRLSAHAARIEGRMSDALRQERVAERLYESLPIWARW